MIAVSDTSMFTEEVVKVLFPEAQTVPFGSIEECLDAVAFLVVLLLVFLLYRAYISKKQLAAALTEPRVRMLPRPLF